MSRRSRSQRPQKPRQSETPSQDKTVARAVEQVEPLSAEPSSSAPPDELAVLDAGWDTLLA